MGRMFGTDGVRGLANSELTPELAFDLGLAGAYVITNEAKHKPNILVGVDSRISGDMLESALVAGMCAVGANVYIAGNIPTPAIAYLVRKNNMDAGVMISASHNKVADNGIKFFDKNGYKLKDEIEDEIEDIILNKKSELPRPTGVDVGRKYRLDDANNSYINYLESTIVSEDLSGLRVAIDCANGATSYVAKKVLENLGAEVFAINNNPDGTNINDNCGSTHMEAITEFVKNNKVDVGFAFDGDGDRCLACDENGNEIDGDQLLSIIGMHLKEENKLKNDTIVATIMSNLGLKVMGKNYSINVATTDVGDRYVLEHMIKNGNNLGGEQSGHIIMLDYNTTGDGILAALQVLDMIKIKNKKVSEINVYMKKMPQVLVNAKVDNSLKYKYMENEHIKSAIEKIESLFDGNGRVLIRPSGTEPLVRVMIEGDNQELLQTEAETLAKLIENKLC